MAESTIENPEGKEGNGSGEHLRNTLHEHGLQLHNSHNGDYVGWHHHAHDHPRNWTWLPTFYTLFVVGAWVILTTIGTSASSRAKEEFGISEQVGYLIFTTITLMGEGCGGVLVAPLSESYGRKTVFLCGAVLATIGCGVSAVPHPSGVTIGRFLTGFAAAIPPTVSSGIIKDMFQDSANTDWAMFVWMSISNAGLTTGPIFSAYLVYNLGWQWPFYVSTIVCFVLTIASAGMPESRASRRLSKKVKNAEKATDLDDLPTRNSDAFSNASEFVKVALLRPLRLLFTEPIVAVSAVIGSTIISLAYGLTAGLDIVYVEFGFSNVEASLAFVPILIGIVLSIIPRLCDRWQWRKAKQQDDSINTSPEAKLWSFGYAVPAFAVGFWLFAWTIHPMVFTHWIVSMLGLVLFGYALNDINFVLSIYVAESYGLYAASACSGLVMTRATFSCVFAQFTTPFFVNLGPNIAVSILGAIATVFCLAPPLFTRYGKALRKRSPFAQQSHESNT